MSFRIEYSAVSDIGCVRRNNEDMAYVAGRLLRDGADAGEVEEPVSAVAFAVADGMGGYEGGEVASEIVCRSFANFMRKADSFHAGALKQWAVETNDMVATTARLRPELAEMGTTFVALIFAGAHLRLINIGDSRCYRLRRGVLQQMSTDHSEINRTGDASVPSNLIYNFFGNEPAEFFADVSILDPAKGDVYLLCSDGLSDLVADADIAPLISEPWQLVEMAKEAGGRDNITVISIKI